MYLLMSQLACSPPNHVHPSNWGMANKYQPLGHPVDDPSECLPGPEGARCVLLCYDEVCLPNIEGDQGLTCEICAYADAWFAEQCTCCKWGFDSGYMWVEPR